MRIQAAVLRERGAVFKIEDVDLAEPGPGEVLVAIAGTGFCHTDLLPRTDGFMAQPPLILGHEGTGVVTALGPGTSDIAVGTRVVVDIGGTPIGGHWFGQSSFATHAVAQSRNVVPVPDDAPLELLGPLACGVLTGAGSVLQVLKVSPGTNVAVYGAGAVGLSAVMAAAASGAERIIAVDRHRSRLELALELGATDVVHVASGSDAGAAIRSQVPTISGGGTHTALDTTGFVLVIAAAVAALRVRGTLGLVSAATGDITLPFDALAAGKTMTGILEGDAVPRVLIPQLLELWRQGRMPFDRLIRTYPIGDINQAEADMASGKTIKPVLLPGAST